MHAVCLGVVKRFRHKLIDSANRYDEYYIGNKKNVIINRIKSVQGTQEITKLPRSLKVLVWGHEFGSNEHLETYAILQ